MHNYVNLEAENQRQLAKERAKEAEMKKFKVLVEHEINDADVADLLCTAFEGGSNYWYMLEGYEGDTTGVEFKHIWMPFKPGGAVLVSVPEDDDGKIYKLNREAVQRGLSLMASEYPHRFRHFLEGDYDADDGDVFLQLALFGDVIF